MSRRTGSILLCACLLTAAASALPAAEENASPVQVKEMISGSYTILQMNREVGVERFTRTVYDNNRMVLETTSIFTSVANDSMIEQSKLTLEDDSYFLLAFTSDRRAGALRHATEITMLSNVASITTITNGKRNQITRVLPVGALLIQGGLVNHLELLLLRYNREAGGKQSMPTFDPIGKQEYYKIVENAGIEETEVNGAMRPLTLYKVHGEKTVEAKLYVDETNRIVKAENPLQRMVFLLQQDSE